MKCSGGVRVVDGLPSLSRRALLPILAAVLAPQGLDTPVFHTAFGPRPALAVEPSLETFTGPDGFSWKTPASWGKPQMQTLPDGRQLVVSVDPNDADFNVFFASTPVQADYSSLGSFGNLDYVGGTFLPQCPVGQCTLERDGIAGRMISQSASRGGYTFEYSIQQQGQPMRRLRTQMLLQTEEGRGKAIVTLTAQCTEGRVGELSPTLTAIIDSLALPGK
eukprot:scaffold110603_cov34-Tisochrysis_lutea.AAC.9